MFFSVCAFGWEKGQVLNPVVVPYAVDVVDFFGREKNPPQLVFHHNPVFKYFTAHGRGMSWSGDADISVAHGPTVLETTILIPPLRLRDSRLRFLGVDVASKPATLSL